MAVVPASSLWAAALALQSGAHEGLGDNIPALLAAAQAAELDPGAEPYLEAVERLSRRVPEAAAAAAAAGGSAGLRRHLAAAEEAALPEFKRQRPQYWYYYEWMRDRIEKQVGRRGGGGRRVAAGGEPANRRESWRAPR